MLEELSTEDLQAINGLCNDWFFRNRELTIANASPEQIDILVTYNKVRRLLAERCIDDES
jgi:hypothetical protein